MGRYLNPGNKGFREIEQSEYVDKTGLIALINKTIETPEKLTCVSRPRRFGKSYAAKMLCAYYDCSCDSDELFDGREIAGMLVVELKWNKTAEGALRQIQSRNYPTVLKDYGGEIVLAGISYDAKTRRHSCVIEKIGQTP